MNFLSARGIAALADIEINRTTAVWCRAAVLGCAASIPICMTACGMAASPQPPSLGLPKPVHDLTAKRIGDRVVLDWTTPKSTTDKLKLKAPVQVQICRQTPTDPCQQVATIAAAPGKPMNYTDPLSAVLARGALRSITYTVLANNRHGRSAAPSNAALALAGTVPPAIVGLSAAVSGQGVVLRWQPSADLPPGSSIRFHRTTLSAGSSKAAPPARDPAEQTFQVAAVGSKDPGGALDPSAVSGHRYQYVAERVTPLQVGSEHLQAASDPSAPVIVYTRDTFPPAAPTGLVAVPLSAAINDGKPEVDLSWSANTERDFAQYLVYRRKTDPENSGTHSSTLRTASQQIAPEDSAVPLVVPAFRDMRVKAGQSYAYSIIAVDNAGNKSLPSPEVVVTVPNP